MRTQILSVCTDAYEEDFAPYLDLLGEAVHVLATIDRQLVCHAAWVARELRAGGVAAPMKAAYIEAVATPSRLQGKGFGRQVMAAIPPQLAAFDIAAPSPSEEGFYAQLGWERWRGQLSYLENGTAIEMPEELAMIYRLPKTPKTLNLDAPLQTDWREGDVW
jgi:GNAT superfamily N-acetyltransferase